MMDGPGATERPIGFDGNNVIFDTADEDLLGLKSPALVDVVADRSWEYLGRFQQHRAELISELQGMDANELGAAARRSSLIRQLEVSERDITRLEVFCQAVGAVSLQTWLHDKES